MYVAEANQSLMTTACTGWAEKKQAPTDLSIKHIKTCRRSYFFIKVECQTSHRGKCKQASVGIKYFID